MFRRTLLGLVAALLFATPLAAQVNTNGGIYISGDPTDRVTGQRGPLLTDVDGRLVVTGGGSGAMTLGTCGVTATDLCKTEDVARGAADTGVAIWGQVTDGTTVLAASGDYGTIGTDTAGNVRTVGPVADDAASQAGNPVPVGGDYDATLPTYLDGDRATFHVGSRGSLHTELCTADGTVCGNVNTPTDALTNSTNALATRNLNMSFNGTTWDRAFNCDSSVSISVAAGTTTELVALQSSQVIRVCSFVVSGDTLATTAQFRYGTGAACGTGTTNLTGAMRMPDEGSIAISAGGAGQALFRSAASNALCITTATGAVTGFVTYDQF